MRKYRAAYGIALFTCAALMFGFGSGFLLAVCILLALLPPALYGMLRLDKNKMNLEYQLRDVGQVGQDLHFSIGVRRSGIFMAAGAIEVTLAFRNKLFGNEAERKFLLPLRGNGNGYQCPLTPTLCGEVEVECRKAVCYDLLGLCTLPLKKVRTQAVTVYPAALPLQILPFKMPRGNLTGSQNYRNRRGGDVSEVFDLREYTPGDDMRSIHWKLSGKMDNLILREGSEPSQDYTLVLFDAGAAAGEAILSAQLLSSAVALGAAVSSQLAEYGISHEIAIPAGGSLQHFEVRSRNDHLLMLRSWMGLQLQKKAGAGLEFFVIDKLDQTFTRLIYITADDFPVPIQTLSERMDVTVLRVTEEGKETRAAEEGRCQLIELPIQAIYDRAHQIVI